MYRTSKNLMTLEDNELVMRAQKGEMVAFEELVCRYDRLVYPINDGIPVLLEEKATAISLEELEALKKG